MIPKFNKVHNRFQLNGQHYSYEDLKEVSYSLIKEGSPNEKAAGEFLIEWISADERILVKTSGSTGKPKNILLSKQAMVNSAIATGDFFSLNPGSKALHCLPNDFIAGKMMLVRAMVLGLDLHVVAATSTPIQDSFRQYDFAAMVPLQVENSLQYLKNVKTLIIGGAPVSNELKSKLLKMETQCYETYGMTETSTHVAVKEVSKNSQSFKAIPKVSFSNDDRNCLIISAEHLEVNDLVTNDVVELINHTQFNWIGRYDNVINTGGVKVFPEEIEAKLVGHIQQPYFISSLPDTTLGQQVVLYIEGEEIEHSSTVFDHLSKFEKPKSIIFIPKFARSSSGKIQRGKSIALI